MKRNPEHRYNVQNVLLNSVDGADLEKLATLIIERNYHFIARKLDEGIEWINSLKKPRCL